MQWHSHGGGRPSHSWDRQEQAQDRSHGKSADGDDDGGNTGWGAGWGSASWQDRSRGASSQSWDEQSWDDNAHGKSRGYTSWQDRSRGASSQSYGEQSWKQRVNALSLEPSQPQVQAGRADSSCAGPQSRCQSRAEWSKQDLVAAADLVGLEWWESNCQDGPMLKIEHFQKVEMGDSWKTHNQALKYFRDQCIARYGSGEPEDYGEYGLESDLQSRYGIPHAVHKPKKPDYTFDFTTIKDWHWQQMIGQLDADSMEFVVHDEDRSRGIVRCSLLMYPKGDMKTNRKNRDNLGGQEPETEEKTFDFVIWRSDGSCLTLHPDYKTTKNLCTIGIPPPDYEVPKTGIGGSSGKTSFRHFVMKGVDRILRFDAQKCTVNPQSVYVAPAARVRLRTEAQDPATQPQSRFSGPPPPPPGGPPSSQTAQPIQPPVDAVPVGPVPAQTVQPVNPHPPLDSPPGVFIYADGKKTGLPPPPPPRARPKANPPPLYDTVADNTAAPSDQSGLNASKDASPQSRHTDGIMAPSNALRSMQEGTDIGDGELDFGIERCFNLPTYYGGEREANREEANLTTIDAAVVNASQSWPVPKPPVTEPTPQSETTPKAPPPVPPPPSPRRLDLGPPPNLTPQSRDISGAAPVYPATSRDYSKPPPLLTPQSRDISGAAPASSTEDYAEPQAHVPQTEDNASTPAPAPSTEENASPPAPAPSTEENASPPAPAPSTEENASPPAPAPSTEENASPPAPVPSTADNVSQVVNDEGRGESGDSEKYELLPEPTWSDAATALQLVYAQAADLSDEP